MGKIWIMNMWRGRQVYNQVSPAKLVLLKVEISWVQQVTIVIKFNLREMIQHLASTVIALADLMGKETA